MNLAIAIVLGAVQGLTEFIPISSSGHLIIARELLGVNLNGGLSFDAVLQLATALSLLVYFWKDLASVFKSGLNLLFGREVSSQNKTLLFAIVFGTIPAVVLGLFFENMMETVFRNINLVAIMLILGSLLFYIADKYSENNKEKTDLSLKKGIIIGFFQCLALIPGMSRSGSTISGGLLFGLNKETAVRFSFLLSFPILFGAGVKKLFEVRGDIFSTDFGLALFLGSITAFATGLLAINFLVKYLKNHNFGVFIWYRVLLAVVILIAVNF